MLKRFLFYSLVLVTFTSLSSSRFNSSIRLGAFIIVNPISHQTHISNAGFTGIVTGTMASSMGNELYGVTGMGKYAAALVKVEPELYAKERIRELYFHAFLAKQVDFIELEEKEYKEKINTYIHRLPKFIAPKETKKKYYTKDLRFLKELYNIDQILLVNADYGIYSWYTLGIERSRHGIAKLESVIVNLTDNSIIYEGQSTKKYRLKGKWNEPPFYEKVKTTINQALQSAILKEEERLHHL